MVQIDPVSLAMVGIDQMKAVFHMAAQSEWVMTVAARKEVRKHTEEEVGAKSTDKEAVKIGRRLEAAEIHSDMVAEAEIDTDTEAMAEMKVEMEVEMEVSFGGKYSFR